MVEVPVVIQRQKPSSETAQSCMSWSDAKANEVGLYVEGEEINDVLLDGRDTSDSDRDSLMTKS